MLEVDLFGREIFPKFDTLIVPNGCEEAYSKSDWGKYIREESYNTPHKNTSISQDWFQEMDNDNAEYESYLALGGDPEKYKSGCLDDYMDSIGL